MQQYCDKRYAKHALGSLRSAGYRLTRPRRLVIEALSRQQGPASPYEVQRALEELGEHLDHVTIYRVLETLEKVNLAHKVLSVGGYVRCMLGGESGCHGHLVCRGCGKLEEFADASLCRREDELAERHGFRAERHRSEFSGLCAVCQGQTP